MGCRPQGGQLLQHFLAIPPLLDHPLHTPGLSLDPSETANQTLFRIWRKAKHPNVPLCKLSLSLAGTLDEHAGREIRERVEGIRPERPSADGRPLGVE